MKNLLIYSVSNTERLSYILNFFWGNNYHITNSVEDFRSHIGAKIAYSSDQIDERAYWIQSTDLLQKQNIEPQSCNISYWKNLPIFFQNGGDLPFDILAASFYLLSRYEEYLPHEKDQYGRYKETNAIAFKEKFLHLPLVDLWFQQVETILQEKFSDYQPQLSTFRYIPTFDIDMPYALLHKPFYVQVGRLAKNMLNGNREEFNFQINILTAKTQDPFDTFSLLDTQINQYVFSPLFFFLVAKKYARYDKNPSPSNIAFQELIKNQSKKYTIGIHPSWQSGDNKHLVQQEKEYLETTTSKKITKSRQHYIRMTLPVTYQHLIQIGIQEDYSMGYGNVDGFRASTSKPLFWFDLSSNKRTQLKIHPFCWMDATAFHHTKENPEQVVQKLQYYLDIIQKVNGQMITIMHNNYFAPTSDTMEFRQAMLSFWENTFSGKTDNKKI